MSTSEVEPVHDLRGLLRIVPFRRLWISLGLASLGDWLSFLAAAALAHELTRGAGGSYAAQNLAIGGVFLIRLLPALVIGPIAGAVADRLDRRWTMIICALARALLLASIPLVDSLIWLFIAIFLIEVASLFWIPAKEATIPNLVPRSRLEAANQLSLVTTYGTAPLAAAVFVLLTLLTGSTARFLPFFARNPVDLAFYINALTFLAAAVTIWRLTEIPKTSQHVEHPSMVRTVLDGWRFIFSSPMLRGLVTGMLGAFAAGGVVVGLARTFVTDLGAGDPGFGMLFGTVFIGMATGMFLGPRLLSGFSRRRLFALSIVGAGATLCVLAIIGNIVIVVLLTFLLGALAGTAWVIGQTLIGLEVSDELRGRTFAFVQSLVRITLVLVLAAGPLVAAAIGAHRIEITDQVDATYNGAAITMFFAGLLAGLVGFISFRQMDDRPGVPVWRDLIAAIRGEPLPLPRALPGFLLALEGGEGAGKSTQGERLADWLRDNGYEVLLTHEPGATEIGERLRSVLLDVQTGVLSPRTEALLYAADRAEHVSTVIRPALERGAVVITDRFIDSSVAYQGAGRELPPSQIAKLSRWATDGLRPDLTVLLDVPSEVGRGRGEETPDRLESEPDEFHDRVRQRYLALAEQTPYRYLVVDATESTEAVAERIQERIRRMLFVSTPPDEVTATETADAVPADAAATAEPEVADGATAEPEIAAATEPEASAVESAEAEAETETETETETELAPVVAKPAPTRKRKARGRPKPQHARKPQVAPEPDIAPELAAGPQPPAAEPEPRAAEPEPRAAEPEPRAAEPEPRVAEPEPVQEQAAPPPPPPAPQAEDAGDAERHQVHQAVPPRRARPTGPRPQRPRPPEPEHELSLVDELLGPYPEDPPT